MERLDGSCLVGAIAAAGGPNLELVERLGGGAVGAFIVRRNDGAEFVLTASQPLRSGVEPGQFDMARALMDVARSHGVPAPRYVETIVLGDGGVAVLQERVVGVPVVDVSPVLVERVVDLAEMRRGILGGTPYAQRPCPLFLVSSGPGFCHHGPLRQHTVATRDLVARIEAVGAEVGDSITGSDLVHLDYHLGNVLVAPDDPDRVVAIVDWDGARAGDIALDLTILRFDLSWRAPSLGTEVERHLQAATDPQRFQQAWAHASLRLVDWAIRHHPHEVDHWLTLAWTHL